MVMHHCWDHRGLVQAGRSLAHLRAFWRKAEGSKLEARLSIFWNPEFDTIGISIIQTLFRAVHAVHASQSSIYSKYIHLNTHQASPALQSTIVYKSIRTG